jgi:RNase P/RNase MRP subunit POP5
MENERTRYANIRFISLDTVKEKDAWFSVSLEVKRLFGVIGASDAGLFLSYYDEENQGGIFRCAHLYIHKVHAALCFINKKHNRPLFLYVENVSGTLKKAQKQLSNSKNLLRYRQIRTTLNDYWKTTFHDDKTTNRHT